MFPLQKGRTYRLNVQSAKVDVAWDLAPHWGEKKKKVGRWAKKILLAALSPDSGNK